jgi:hypothetical protein
MQSVGRDERRFHNFPRARTKKSMDLLGALGVLGRVVETGSFSAGACGRALSQARRADQSLTLGWCPQHDQISAVPDDFAAAVARGWNTTFGMRKVIWARNVNWPRMEYQFSTADAKSATKPPH